MGSLKLSIALLAYNRERFLAKQLESIVAQSRLPDELVIGDDCSTDRTAEIISDFAAHAPFPVHWYVNESNQGFSRNAEHAIQLCSGDVIVFCDDDDVCLPEKLQVTEEEFLGSPATGLMVSNSALVGEKLSPSGITLWDAHKFTAREAEAVLKDPISYPGQPFHRLLGTSISFRASLRDYILPFPRNLRSPQIFRCVGCACLGIGSKRRLYSGTSCLASSSPRSNRGRPKSSLITRKNRNNQITRKREYRRIRASRRRSD